MLTLVAAVAASSPTSAATSFSITQVLQFGILGLIFLCVVFRKYVVPEWTLKAAEERSAAEKAELTARLAETREQLNSLQSVFQDQMIPALTRATEVNARYTDELQQARYARKTKPDSDDE
jgi:hypothetical protein